MGDFTFMLIWKIRGEKIIKFGRLVDGKYPQYPILLRRVKMINGRSGETRKEGGDHGVQPAQCWGVERGLREGQCLLLGPWRGLCSTQSSPQPFETWSGFLAAVL